MALSTPTVTLGADARSVQQARQWALDVCDHLRRPDLVETVELAMSEVVTNAFLHASPPYTLSVTGTPEHPRFSVRDCSTAAPRPVELDDEISLSTIGRGLSIVAMCATSWGAQIDGLGKVVWFEPRTDLGSEGVDGELPQGKVAYHGWEQASDLAALTRPMEIRLHNCPLEYTYAFYLREREIRRELRLLVQSHRDTFPEARELLDRMTDLEPGYFVVDERGNSYVVPPREARPGATRELTLYMEDKALTAYQQLDTAYALLDEYIASGRLLILPATPGLNAYMAWVFGEVLTQGNGGPATPWNPGMVDQMAAAMGLD